MNPERDRTPPAPKTRRWAPWWVYVVVIVGAGYARQFVVPASALPGWGDVVLAFGLAAVLFVIVTAVFRALLR